MTERSEQELERVPTIQKVTAVLWPSFLTAGVATMLFFTAFDPLEMSACMGYEGVTRLGAYSIGFFLFWLLTSLSCLVSSYFLRPCYRVNQPRGARQP